MSKQDYTIVLGDGLSGQSLIENEIFVFSYIGALALIDMRGWPDSFIFTQDEWSVVYFLESLMKEAQHEWTKDHRRMPVYLKNVPENVATKVLNHYDGQSGTFQQMFEVITPKKKPGANRAA